MLITLIADLRFDNDQISGTVRLSEGQPYVFSGWIGLLGAINTLRRECNTSADMPLNNS